MCIPRTVCLKMLQDFDQNISSWDVSSVTNMAGMFENAEEFNQDISGWDVSNVTIMSGMFSEAESFNQDISGWDVSNVTSIGTMFNRAEAFNQDIGDWNLASVTGSMGSMFRDAISFNQDLLTKEVTKDGVTYTAWDVSDVTRMTFMFEGATNFNGDISNWDTSSVTDMEWMFTGATNFNQDIGDWNVSNVTDMQRMFEGAASFNQNLNDWDVSSVTTMYYMFLGATNFNGDLSNWEPKNVTDMSKMFEGTSFNQDISAWDVSSVITMYQMFRGTPINQDLNDWDVSNVTRMDAMFWGAANFNGDISNWDTSSVTRMNKMFYYANSFNQDISTKEVTKDGVTYTAWDVSNVTRMNDMFHAGLNQTSLFNQDISNWDVSKVTDMEQMFYYATSFNQDLNWNVSSVTDFSSMFYAAQSFDQDLSSWDISSATNMGDMFKYANSLSNANKGLIHSYFYSNSSWPYDWSAFVVNYAPAITSNGGAATAALNAPENQTFAADVNATDADGDAVSYFVSGGADAGKFDLNATTGVLNFNPAPDYENPTDADANNTYVVEVTATDGVAADIQVPSAAYPTIQSAIDGASAGDVIRVAAGTYAENIWIADNDAANISVIGAGPGKSIIDGNGTRPVTFYKRYDNGGTLSGFTIQNGDSAQGGAVYFSRSNNSVLSNVVMTGNKGEAGVVFINRASPTLDHVTVVNNQNMDGKVLKGAIYTEMNSACTLTNSIIWGNTGVSSYGQLNATSTGGSSTITVSNSIYSNATGSVADGGNNSNGDPLLDGNFEPQNGSPAIGAGSDGDMGAIFTDDTLSSPQFLTVTVTDVNEAPTAIALGAPVASLAEDADTSSATKIGAIAVTDPDTTNSSSLAEGNVHRVPSEFATIQAAIDASSNGDEVFVSAGTYVENLNYNGKNISVIGEDRATTIIDGNQTGAVVTFTNSEGPTARLIGFTITNGSGTDGGGGTLYGGGIYCYGASPTIKDVKITGNTVNHIYGGGGGLACLWSASPYLENVIISDNYASNKGGGIRLYQGSVPTLKNVTVTNNAAGGVGGTAYMRANCGLILINTILWANTPQEIYFEPIDSSGSMTVDYSDIAGGQAAFVTTGQTVNWGTGNVDADPLFVDAGNGDFNLQAGSPAINAGDPSSALDPDGSVADMGAFHRDANVVTLSGLDAASFEVVGAELFLKAGVALDYETKNSYAVTLTTGGVNVTHTLSVTNVADANDHPSFTSQVISSSADYAHSVHAEDVDGDGDMDVLSASADDDKIAWYENDGSGSFTEHVISTSADGAVSVHATDVDGDGDMDVLAASRWDNKIAWYENDGSENFTEQAISTSAGGAYFVYSTDLDGDGDMDVLSASRSDDKIAWYKNDGSENFTAHVISTSADYARSVHAADVDGDGDMDVLSASVEDDKIAWYENDGSESFTTHVISTSADGAFSVYAADVDGDGDVDVLSASYEDDKIAWYENDGSESFTTHVISTSADNARGVHVADLDGDGDMDVLSASHNDDKIAWYENNGSESFTEHVISTSADGALDVHATDVDGDGDLDILSTSASDDKVTWYEQVGSPFKPATKTELQTAVNLWISDKATALSTYGVINSWNVSLITDMSTLFENKSTFNDDISGWDVSSVTNMYKMFKGASSFNQNLSNWDVSNVTNMRKMFYYATVFNGNISNWNVTGVGNMNAMFYHATNFNQSLSGWDVSNVNDMSSMFQGASNFNQVLSTWDVSSVTTMVNMFASASNFNADISDWNVSSVTNMQSMFSSATSFNQDISSWNVSNVTNMNNVFYGAQNFNQDISSWDVSSVTSIQGLFAGSPFNHNISGWDVSNVTSMRELFNNSPDFNQDLASWDVSSVTNMSKMFYNAASYNQNISSWDVSNATDMANMFYGQNSLSNANKGLIHTSFSPNSNWPYDWSAHVVNSAPVITSYDGNATVALNAPENQTFAADVNASDADGNTLTYSKSNGADASKFTINVATGALGFSSAPDFENPTDADANNTYVVEVNASDGTAWDLQTITVTVTDVVDANDQPSFTTRVISTNYEPASLFASDMDGDGDMDVVTASRSNDTIAWLENDGAAVPSFTAHDIATNADLALGVYVADMDGDGDMDVVSASAEDDTIAWYENDGAADPSFAAHDIATNADGAWGVFAADMDGDGDMDILSASYLDDTIAWYENDGAADPSFTASDIATDADGASSVFAADMDGDGDMDILSANRYEKTVTWYENDGAADPTWIGSDIETNEHYVNTVFAADMDGDGDMDIVSAAEGDLITWYENDGAGDPGFTKIPIATNADSARDVHVADLDGDGDMDVFSASYDDDKIAWYENDGAADPGFTAHVITTNANGAYDVFIADLDGDGDMDVLSGSHTDDKIAWYEQVGSPFKPATKTELQTAVNLWVSDKATALSTYGVINTWNVSLITNMSNLFYNKPDFNDDISNWDVSSVTTMYKMFAYADNFSGGDLSGWDVSSVTNMGEMFREADDFVSDLSAWEVSNVTNMHMMFRDTHHFNSDISGWDVSKVTDMHTMFGATGDFNQDISDWDVSNVTVFGSIFWNANSLSNTNKGLIHTSFSPNSNWPYDWSAHAPNAPPVITSYGGNPTAAVNALENQTFAADVNASDADGDALSYSISGGADASKFDLNATSGVLTFKTAPDYENPTDTDSNNAYVVEVNASDGTAWDLQTLTVTVTDVYANDHPTFTSHVISTSADKAYAVHAADMDGDGDLDVLSASYNDDKIAWYENDGSGNFTTHVISTNGNGPQSVYAADLDSDGDMDALSFSQLDDTVAWHKNDGSENFTRHVIDSAADGGGQVRAADVDGDGDMDALSAIFSDGTIAWYENNGNQSFTKRIVTSSLNGALSVYPVDLDGDGDVDVLSASNADNKVAWHENDGSESFTPHVITTSSSGPVSVTAADLDGDGDMDVLSASYGDDKIAWHENDGNENFTSHAITTSADHAVFVSVADLDGDGDMDVLSASRDDDKISWYENNGTGNFTTHVITTSANGATSVFTADIDGDGDLDVLSSSRDDDKIAWYERNGSPPFKPTTKTELQTAVNLWVSDKATALSTYGEINTWNVSLITNMSNLFYNKPDFNDDISNWDVSSVTTMYKMFAYADNFSGGDLSGWDVSSVTNMGEMFREADDFVSDLSAWEVSNVTNMHMMFRDTHHFNSDISGWNVSSVTDMHTMFGATGDFNQDISDWDVSNVTVFGSMFWNANSLSNTNKGLIHTSFSPNSNWPYDWSALVNSAPVITSYDGNATIALNAPENQAFAADVNANDPDGNATVSYSISGGADASKFDLNATSGVLTFKTAPDFENPTDTDASNTYVVEVNASDGTAWDLQTITVTVTNGAEVFKPTTKTELQTAVNLWVSDKATALSTYGEINTWNVSLITDMKELFLSKSTFNDNISNWDVSNVTNMHKMFKSASSFNQNLSNWDVSNVTKMNSMFLGANTFNQPLANWDVSNVRDMYSMFAHTGFNEDISNWDVSSVLSMRGLFYSNSQFNQNISDWNVSNVTNFINTFYGASSFNQDLSNWDVSSATSMYAMFYRAYDFNQDISGWDVSNVITMYWLFHQATSFNQDLSSWDVSNATSMTHMFTSANALSNANKGFIHSTFSPNSNWPYDWSAFVTQPPPNQSTPTLFRPLPNTLSHEELGESNYRFWGLIQADGGSPVTGVAFELADNMLFSNATLHTATMLAGSPNFSATTQLEGGKHYYYRALATNSVGTAYDASNALTTPSTQTHWWSDSVETTGGWRTSPWFGTFRPYDNGWIYHAKLGWAYAHPDGSGGLWLWLEDHHWMWTQQGVFPYLWKHDLGTWHYLVGLLNGKPFFIEWSESVASAGAGGCCDGLPNSVNTGSDITHQGITVSGFEPGGKLCFPNLVVHGASGTSYVYNFKTVSGIRGTVTTYRNFSNPRLVYTDPEGQCWEINLDEPGYFKTLRPFDKKDANQAGAGDCCGGLPNTVDTGVGTTLKGVIVRGFDEGGKICFPNLVGQGKSGTTYSYNFRTKAGARGTVTTYQRFTEPRLVYTDPEGKCWEANLDVPGYFKILNPLP